MADEGTVCCGMVLVVVYVAALYFYTYVTLGLTAFVFLMWLACKAVDQRKLKHEAIAALDRVNEEYKKEYGLPQKGRKATKEKRAYVHKFEEAVAAFNRRNYKESLRLATNAHGVFRAEELREKQRREETQRGLFESSQRAKGLVKHGAKWGTPEQVKRWKEIEVGLDDNFASMSPYRFEEFIAELFRRMGYEATKTKNTGDYGADVIARKDGKTVVIQAKRYARGTLVTPDDVQRTLGAMWKYKADKAVVVTTSDFTTRAKDLEHEAPIELWDKDILHRMVRKYFINLDAQMRSRPVEEAESQLVQVEDAAGRKLPGRSAWGVQVLSDKDRKLEKFDRQLSLQSNVDGLRYSPRKRNRKA